MIVQNVSHDGAHRRVVHGAEGRPAAAARRLDASSSDIGAAALPMDDGIAKVSLVGAGMKSHPGVAADMFAALAAEGINIEMISTSSIRISCVIRREDAERARPGRAREVRDRRET